MPGLPISMTIRPTRKPIGTRPARKSGRILQGLVTHFVAAIGTGGTITGTSEFLKSVSGGAVAVVGADPLTSVYSGGDGSPFFVEAAGHYLNAVDLAILALNCPVSLGGPVSVGLQSGIKQCRTRTLRVGLTCGDIGA